jgi:cell division protein FtsL
MLEQPTTLKYAVAANPPTAKTGFLSTRIAVNPVRLPANYRLAASTILMSLAVLMYLLQVNHGAWIDFQLGKASGEETLLNARIAQLLVEKDRLLAASRIDTLATSKLHMRQPSLNSALWLRVRLPARFPTAKHEPSLQTGPLVWLRHAATVVRDSL